MNNFYFLRCGHCGREYSADPQNFVYIPGHELCICPICMKPPMDLMHKGHRGITKVLSRACVDNVRFPPVTFDTKDITVLLVQRGYKRFQINENGMIHTFWALSQEDVIQFEHTLLWVYPVKKVKIDVWTNQDTILFDREKENMRDYGIDKVANARFLKDINPEKWTEEEKRR